jgi:translation initiation factor IF-2
MIEVLATFGKQEGNRQIIGGKVTKGYVENNEKFEVFRSDKKVGEGRIINLQSQKEDIPKAEEGQEVGLLVESEVDILEGHRLVFTQ